MSDADWNSFLNHRFPGKKWSRWFGKTPDTIHSVVAVNIAAVVKPMPSNRFNPTRTSGGVSACRIVPEIERLSLLAPLVHAG